MKKTIHKYLLKLKETVLSWYMWLRNLISRLRHKLAFRIFVLWLLSYLTLMSFFFNTILKNYSYIEIFPNELIFPAVMHAATALVIALAMCWTPWLKSFAAKLGSSIVMVLLIIGYDAGLQTIAGPLRAFMPGLTDSDPLPLVSLVYLLLLGVVAVCAGVGLERVARKTKRVQSRDIELGLLALVAYLFIVPAFSVAKMLPTMRSETHTQAPEISGPKNAASPKEKPDIFYIVLDRYTNANVLKKQFNYDNSSFIGFLKNNNFHVNNNAYSNYPYTTMSVSSTMNAQYTNELVAPYKDSSVQSRTLYHNLIWQSSVAKALKKEGYKYYAVGSSYGATYKAPLADRDYMSEHQLTLFGRNKRLRGIEAIEFMGSPYYRFAQMPNIKWWPAKVADSDHISNVRQQLNILDDVTTKEKPGGRFIFAHILVPHEPFAFNADGSLSNHPESNNLGKPVKDKYVDQVAFINTQMKELARNIQKQSRGKAVIIFNADEGPYPQVLNDTFKKPLAAAQANTDSIVKDEDMRQWPDDWLKMKFGVLQAVHIPRATGKDLSNLSSVNVFRIVLNRYAGFNLDYLPECHFGLTKDSHDVYNYADITQRLTADSNKNCKQLQSLPSK